MIVRRATPADIPEIVRLKAQLMRTGWPWPVDVDEDQAWRERCAEVAASLLSDDDYAAFVVPRDDPEPGQPLAAMVSVATEQHLPGPQGSGRSAYIGDMSTDPDLRGRGMGSRLLHDAMTWAKEQGATRINLYSTESGLGVYQRAGFESSRTNPFEHMGRSLDDFDPDQPPAV